MFSSIKTLGRKVADFSRNCISKTTDFVVDTAKSVKTWLIGGTVGAVVSGAAEVASASGATLPDIGVNPADYITTIGTTLGGIFAAVIGLGLAFWVARKGIKMMKGGVN